MSSALSARRATVAIAGFFVAKIASGLLILKLSAAYLPVAGFGVFSQFLLLGALLSSLAVAGAQNGVVREAAVADGDGIATLIGAACLIWLPTVAIAGLVAILFGGFVSEALTGTRAHGWAVPLVVLPAVLSGAGQIACAVLSGLGRTGRSLFAQAAGLIAGTCGAAALLAEGRALPAAIVFYLGQLLVALIACPPLLPKLRGAHVDRRLMIAEARRLLGYSAGFVGVFATTTLTLFGLRYAYLSSFSNEQLGLWLVAQRVSDTSTQLLGLFMIQYFVPAYAGAAEERRARILGRCWLVGTAAMLALLAMFAAAPRLWVPLFLSAQYVPAIPMILLYMSGDVARATASLFMHRALARASMRGYAAIEMGAMAAMALITLTLMRSGVGIAPALGYAGAYGGAALLLGLKALRSRVA